MQAKKYSNAELMQREDLLSVIMMIARLHRAADFARLGEEVSQEYLQEVFRDAPEYLLDIVEQITRALLLEVNNPAASNGASSLQRCRAAGYVTLAAFAIQ